MFRDPHEVEGCSSSRAHQSTELKKNSLQRTKWYIHTRYGRTSWLLDQINPVGRFGENKYIRKKSKTNAKHIPARKLKWHGGGGHKEISLAPSTSQTKRAVQQGKVCWHAVLDSGLGPSLVARTVKKNRQLELTVVKQGAEHQQISISFRLEGLKESEINNHQTSPPPKE